MNGLYQVSNLGRVKSLHYRHSNTHTILKTHIYRGGYIRVALSKDGKTKLYHIHRLVAEAFIENPDNLPEINHKDENKLNNEASNLEWCTHRENSNYGTRGKRISKAHINNTYNTKAVQCIETGMIYESAHEAERQTGIGFSQICAVCRGYRNRKTAGGYHWKFIKRIG